MNADTLVWSSLAMQANPAPAQQSTIQWMIDAAGPFNIFLLVGLGFALFIGACAVVMLSRRPALVATYLVLLPVPLLAGILVVLNSNIASMSVIAAGPVTLTGAEIAQGIGESLIVLFVSLWVTLPAYFVLSVGLMFRAYRSSADVGF